MTASIMCAVLVLTVNNFIIISEEKSGEFKYTGRVAQVITDSNTGWCFQ